MTVNLPDDLQRFIQAEVHSGHFASEDDAIAAALRLLRRQLSQAAVPAAADPLLGAMRDAAAEMDEVLADAMTYRERQLWRLPRE
jgi:putative addiction module CopG family antidote